MLDFNLNHEGFEEYLIGRQIRNQNTPYHMVQYVFEFPNEYGASVIKGNYTFGGSQNLWELGVIAFNEDGEFYLDYETGVADDVVGYLTDVDVWKLLKQIKELPVQAWVLED